MEPPSPRLGAGAVSLPRRGAVGLLRAYLAAGLGLSFLFILAILVAPAAYSLPRGAAALLASPHTLRALAVSLFAATLASSLAMALALPAAYTLSRWSFPGRNLLDTLLDTPVVISPVALGATLLLIFSSPPGQAFQQHILRVVFAFPGVVVAQAVVAFGLQVRVARAAFDAVDPRMELVARTLGSDPLHTFLRVTLPLARRGLLTALLLGWARALGEFGATVTLAGATLGRTGTLPVAIYLSLGALRLDEAFALTLLLVAVGMAALATVRILGVGRE